MSFIYLNKNKKTTYIFDTPGKYTVFFNNISGDYKFLIKSKGVDLDILGIIVGFMNVTGKESQTFMIAGAVLVVVSKFGMESISGSIIGIGIGDIFSSIFRALLVLFVPATIIVALKTVFSIVKV